MGSSHTKETINTMSSNNTSQNNSTSQEGGNSGTRPLCIQGPPRNDSNESVLRPVANQPRQPADLQGLLRFAMEATRSENMVQRPQFQPLDQERSAFLSAALSSMTVNVNDELRKAIRTILNRGELTPEDDPSDCELALETITNFIEDIDIANDFYKIGGFSIFSVCLNSPHSCIRWRVANVIAELTQLNPFCQDKILQLGWFPILLNMVDTDPSDKAKVKALYAVSCVVRGDPISLKHMDVNDGYSVLLRALQSPVEKLRMKSAFLLSCLCNDDNSEDVKTILVQMGLVEQTAVLLATENTPDMRDLLLRILMGLTNNNYQPALKECYRPELHLRSTLDRILNELNEDDSLVANNVNELRTQIFSHPEVSEER